MYLIKRYQTHLESGSKIETILNESGEFVVATNSARKCPTVAYAVGVWAGLHTRFYKPEVWIEGPRGGRYDAITGVLLR